MSPDTADLLIGQALNNRLNTTGLKAKELNHLAATKGMTIAEVMAMPELDEYRYSDGLNMVCSNLVAGLWKAAGLFGNLTINANEFNPFDVYRINFFDLDFEPPAHCQDHERTPACILQCVNWVLDIEECAISEHVTKGREPQNNLMDPKTTRNIAVIVSKFN